MDTALRSRYPRRSVTPVARYGASTGRAETHTTLLTGSSRPEGGAVQGSIPWRGAITARSGYGSIVTARASPLGFLHTSFSTNSPAADEAAGLFVLCYTARTSPRADGLTAIRERGFCVYTP